MATSGRTLRTPSDGAANGGDASLLDGFNYVADVYGSYADANSLSSLAPDGVNTVALTADFGIDAENSTVYQNDVSGGYTESNADIAATIADAVNQGLSVMVRPLIDFLPDNYDTAPGQTNPLNGSYSASEWRSYYNPSNVAAFFASYQTMIVDQAKLAQANGATIFCIGTELDQLTGAAYETYWDNIISAVRAVFSGKLTYAADWDDDQSPWQYGNTGLAAGTGNITTQISFWNKLDYVGIDEYAPISDLASPTLNQLIAGWTQTPTDPTTLAVTSGQSLIDYYESISADTGKPLLFTEIGYANSSDADSSPATPGYNEAGNPDSAVADPTLQANLYQAYFDAWHADGNGSLAGAYLWNWEPAGAGISPFAVQGEPALPIVANAYTHNGALAPAPTDFYAEGTSDILFRNDASGDTGFYAINGGMNVGWQDAGASSTAYSIVGTGDFLGNGTADILYRNNATGDTGFYQINNGVNVGWRDVGASSTAYSVVGVGDFLGNGTDDILFRDNATGDTGFYAISNGANTGWHDVGASSTAYGVVGVGDFLDNGTDDILFRNNATGDTGVYAISNGVNTGWVDVGASSTAYSVVGVGDFLGNGTGDILFRNNATGDTGFYAIVNGAKTGWYDVGASSTAYSVVATGDYLATGTSDILFRNNTTGDTGFYAIVNGVNAGWHDVGASSTAYHVAG
jgi:hypothetical protein